MPDFILIQYYHSGIIIFVILSGLFRLNQLTINKLIYGFVIVVLRLILNIWIKKQDEILNEVTSGEYKYGFFSDIEIGKIPKGLNEDIVRTDFGKKNEPEWLLEFRLKAFRHWQTMKMPAWANLKIPEIDYQEIIFYAAPKQKMAPGSLDEIDPELKKDI